MVQTPSPQAEVCSQDHSITSLSRSSSFDSLLESQFPDPQVLLLPCSWSSVQDHEFRVSELLKSRCHENHCPRDLLITELPKCWNTSSKFIPLGYVLAHMTILHMTMTLFRGFTTQAMDLLSFWFPKCWYAKCQNGNFPAFLFFLDFGI